MKMTQITNEGFVLGMSAIAAAIAIMPAFGAGLGQGRAAGEAATAVGRQPEARGDIMITMIVGQAMSETSGIYGMIISLIILFANPLMAFL
jgi:F-type H+-transporting ATPase subunit c